MTRMKTTPRTDARTAITIVVVVPRPELVLLPVVLVVVVLLVALEEVVWEAAAVVILLPLLLGLEVGGRVVEEGEGWGVSLAAVVLGIG